MAPSWFNLALVGFALQTAAVTTTTAPLTTTTTTSDAAVSTTVAPISQRPLVNSKTTVLACSTALTNVSVANVPTIRNLITQSYTVRRRTTVTNTVTITPAPQIAIKAVVVNSTVTVTEGTPSGTATENALSIRTVNRRKFVTITQSIVTNITVTTAPATLTVAASPGFTPLASAVLAAQTGIAKRDDPVQPGNNPKYPQQVLYNGELPGEQFPASVLCNTLIQVASTRLVSIVAPTVRTKFLPPKIDTSTSVTTATITKTVGAGFATTITNTYTSTITNLRLINTTTKTTVTNTITTTSPGAVAPPFYAACAQNNIVGNVNGTGIKVVDMVRLPVMAKAGSAYECCVACLQSDNCAFSQFFPGQQKGCYIARRGGRKSVCNPRNELGDFFTSPDVSPDSSFLSNSNCGQVVFEGILPASQVTTRFATATSSGAGAATPNGYAGRPYQRRSGEKRWWSE